MYDRPSLQFPSFHLNDLPTRCSSRQFSLSSKFVGPPLTQFRYLNGSKLFIQIQFPSSASSVPPIHMNVLVIALYLCDIWNNWKCSATVCISSRVIFISLHFIRASCHDNCYMYREKYFTDIWLILVKYRFNYLIVIRSKEIRNIILSNGN